MNSETFAISKRLGSELGLTALGVGALAGRMCRGMTVEEALGYLADLPIADLRFEAQRLDPDCGYWIREFSAVAPSVRAASSRPKGLLAKMRGLFA